MREDGAGLIAILWPAFWWLDYYYALRDYFELHFRRVAANSRLVAFDLNGKSQSARST